MIEEVFVDLLLLLINLGVFISDKIQNPDNRDILIGLIGIIIGIVLEFLVVWLLLFFDRRLSISNHIENIDNIDNIDNINNIDNPHETRLNQAGFTGEIPIDFIDPVSHTIMVDPVIPITEDRKIGRSYQKDTIVSLTRHSTPPLCPLSRKPFYGYIFNRDLKNIINNWVDKTVQFEETKKKWQSSEDDGKTHQINYLKL